MKTVRVEFSLNVPDEMTDPEIEDFVSFYLRTKSELRHDNPMADGELEAVFGSVWIR